jgi:Tfp pilus assembly protein PilF
MIAEKQRDFAAAESWYRKSLEIKEKQGNEHGAANTFGQLGILAGLQKKFEEAGQWLIKCILVFARCNDNHNAQVVANNFMIFYKQSPTEIQEKLKSMWEKSLGEFPKQE